MSETLLPCPFCGGDAERVDIPEEADYDDNAGGSCIQCRHCMASTALHYEFKENLVSSWNNRVVSDDPEFDEPFTSEELATLDKAWEVHKAAAPPPALSGEVGEMPPFENWFFNEYGGVTCGNNVDDMRAAWDAAADLLARVAAERDSFQRVGIATQARLAEVEKERDEARESAHYATGTAHLAMQHRDAAEAALEKAKEALRWYANQHVYKPHPHGPAFDDRDLSFCARAALAAMEAGDVH